MLHRYVYPLLLSALALHLPFLHSKAQSNSEEKQVQTKELVKDASEFCFSLYSSLNEPSSNILFSPYSIYTCLSMVYAGARGETASQMQTALSLNINQKKLPAASAKLSKMLLAQQSETQSYEMHIANGLWLDLDTFVLSDFRHVAENDYNATVQPLNFSQSDLAMNTVNEWASNHTNGKIPKILQEGDVDGSTRVLLTNAVYFKGSWLKPFDPKSTTTASFFFPPEVSTEVKMMENTAAFPYFENDSMQMLALPFKGKTSDNGQIACLILLPRTKLQLSDVENALTTSNIEEWTSQLKEQSVNVKLPKFNLTKRLDLNQALQALDMKLAFTKDADFSGIDGMRDLVLSKVVHDTFFSLDEAGVTAAAATAASINVTAVQQKNPPIDFNADHPFLFLIVDLNTKTLLFMGKFLKP
jgi:serine protease inhibitor